jgi:hypothetical protein
VAARKVVLLIAVVTLVAAAAGFVGGLAAGAVRVGSTATTGLPGAAGPQGSPGLAGALGTTGPPGPSGPPALLGYHLVQASVFTGLGGSTEADANCGAGQIAVGGGALVQGGYLIASTPLTGGQGWLAQGASSTSGRALVTAYASCLNAP